MLMGTAFSTMTALFTVHALATPTILHPGFNGMMPLAGGLSVPIGAVLLGLTALPALRRPRCVRPLVALQVTLFLGVMGFGLYGLLNPTVLPAVPKAKSQPALGLLFIGAFCLGLLIIRAVRTYLLTRRNADLTVALGCAWLSITLWVNLVTGPMTIGYFLGHTLEICAVALVAIPTALDLRRAGASRALVGDLTATELVESEEAYLGPRVRALMVRLERRDVSTEEHTRRVACLAARVGEELKLSATSRRHLAVGGLLHDIGKLSVPLEVLNKPGKLSDEEFALIKRHPGDGRKLLEELGGFPQAVLASGVRPSRAPGRQWLSPRPGRPEHVHRDAHPRGLRRLRRAGERSRVPRGLVPRARVRAARGGVARVRPDGRRRPQAGGRAPASSRTCESAPVAEAPAAVPNRLRDYPSAIERPLTKPSLDAIWSMTASGTAPSVVIAMTARSLLSPSPGA